MIELRRVGKASARPFVDPYTIARCVEVLDRRGEAWAAAVLGRNIDRRSLGVPARPHLRAGEAHTIVAADYAEGEYTAEAIWNASS